MKATRRRQDGMGTLQLASALIWGLFTSHVTLIGFGGGIGSAARYVLGRAIHENGWTHHFPLGTFLVNFLGSLLLGFLMGLVWERQPHSVAGWFSFLGTGFCGGFTTFSTLQWETLDLARRGQHMVAMLNVGGSIAAGFAGIALGVALGMWLRPGA